MNKAKQEMEEKFERQITVHALLINPETMERNVFYAFCSGTRTYIRTI
jgi:hypothetical protein